MATAWWWAWACVWAVVVAVASTQPAGRGGIKGEPRVTSPWESRKVVREGETVRLVCPITATPEPFYEWFKDGEEVRATWNRYNPKKKMLKVRAANMEDAGRFTCVGVNGFGKINASISLIVLRKGEPSGELMEPELTEVWPEGPLQRRREETLTLSCRARGLPTPVITWYKDDLLLSREGDQLTFSSLSTSDSGRYTCRANSALGGTAANFSLQVGDSSEESKPEISEAVNTTVVEGGTTSLQCTVRTSHFPRVQWLKEISGDNAGEGGAQVPNTTKQLAGRWFRKVEGAGGVVARGDGHYLSKLTIAHASPMSGGVYVCLAVNTLGFSFREAHLTVLQPRGKPYPPVGEKETSVNWLFLIIPGIVVVVVVVAVIVCQLRKDPPDKPVGVTPPTPVLKGDDASALTPLNQDTTHVHQPTLPRPPDLVYQEVSGYTSGSVRGSGHHHHHHQHQQHQHHYDQYPPNAYPESYVDPAYSDPYNSAGDHRGPLPTRASEHSYARLTHPSLASHASSSSPHLPPPPYAHTPHQHQQHPHAHTHTHTHRHPQYFVHYNL